MAVCCNASVNEQSRGSRAVVGSTRRRSGLPASLLLRTGSHSRTCAALRCSSRPAVESAFGRAHWSVNADRPNGSLNVVVMTRSGGNP